MNDTRTAVKGSHRLHRAGTPRGSRTLRQALCVCLLSVVAAMAASSASAQANPAGVCAVLRPLTPYYFQTQNQVRSTTHTSCSSSVYQQVHLCLSKRSVLTGNFVVIVCNNPGGYLFTKTRAAIVTWPCSNTFSLKSDWRAVAWVTVSVNGRIYGSSTITSYVGHLFCK